MEDIKEKSADELFEELGYRKSSDDKYSIEYRKVTYEDLYEIDFWRSDKTVSKNRFRDMGYITIQELKAINKKIEELQW